MTSVTTTNRQVLPETVKITEAKEGSWYKIISYASGTQFDGKIGVLVRIYWSSLEETTPSLITSDGAVPNNEGFILQELESVDISYK
jgi:hypothetical protein